MATTESAPPKVLLAAEHEASFAGRTIHMQAQHHLNRKERNDTLQPEPKDVPVFTCIVYVSKTADGVSARVANLADIQFTAANERDVLRKTITAFKQRITELHTTSSSIPWIDPPSQIAPDEQPRYVPVHL